MLAFAVSTECNARFGPAMPNLVIFHQEPLQKYLVSTPIALSSVWVRVWICTRSFACFTEWWGLHDHPLAGFSEIPKQLLHRAKITF
jgi:hypothetical protein